MRLLGWLKGQHKLTEEEIQLQYIADLREAIEYGMSVIEMRDRYYKFQNFGKTPLDKAKGNLCKTTADVRHRRAKEWLTPVQHKIYLEYISRVNKRRAEKNAK